MYINYNLYNFCPSCVLKFPKTTNNCLECGKPLRKKRRRIISDYLEKRLEKEKIECPECGNKFHLE